MPARRDFEAHLRKGELLPVYAIISQEPLILHDAVSALRQKVLTTAQDFNRDEFTSGDGNPDSVVRAAGTLPVMAPLRWVHLRDVHKLKAKDANVLLSYLDQPNPTTVLCFSGIKLDQRTKFGQRLGKAKAVFGLDPPRERELPQWLQQRARSAGIAIDLDASRLLSELIGSNLGRLDQTLQQMWTYTRQEPIRFEDVDAAVTANRTRSVFELTDAIGGRHLPQASLLLRNILEGGESGLRVLGMITRQLRQLLRIHALFKKGVRGPKIASELGIPPFLVDKLIQQANRYRPHELWSALASAAQADTQLKSTRLAPGIVLDRLLIEMMPEA